MGVRLDPIDVLNAVTVGRGVVTVNSCVEVELVPPAAVTLTLYIPIATPFGTTAPLIILSLITVTEVNDVPLSSLTADTVLIPTPPQNPDPLIDIVVNSRLDPVNGVIELTIGAFAITNSCVEVVLVPPAAVTLTLYVPIATPLGTTAPIITLSLTTVNGEITVPSSSFTAVTVLLPVPPQNPVPVIDIVVCPELDPDNGLNAVTVGRGVVTVNSCVDVVFVPPPVVTLMLYVPIATPLGTIAPLIILSLITVTEVKDVPLSNLTSDILLLPIPPQKPDPLIEIVVNVRLDPDNGEIVVTVGAGVVIVIRLAPVPIPA